MDRKTLWHYLLAFGLLLFVLDTCSDSLKPRLEDGGRDVMDAVYGEDFDW